MRWILVFAATVSAVAQGPLEDLTPVALEHIDILFDDDDDPATPSVLSSMGEIIDMVSKLVDSGHAYRADNGDVYYDVSTFESYGQLSGKQLQDLRAGERVAVDEFKHDPLDFVLWKAAKPAEPSWDSPWGKGRPGWHIECSAMSKKYLGDSSTAYHR